MNLLCRAPPSSVRQVCVAATQALFKVGTACWGLVVHSCKPCKLQALQIMSITDGVEELFGPALGPQKCARLWQIRDPRNSVSARSDLRTSVHWHESWARSFPLRLQPRELHVRPSSTAVVRAQGNGCDSFDMTSVSETHETVLHARREYQEQDMRVKQFMLYREAHDANATE